MLLHLREIWPPKFHDDVIARDGQQDSNRKLCKHSWMLAAETLRDRSSAPPAHIPYRNPHLGFYNEPTTRPPRPESDLLA